MHFPNRTLLEKLLRLVVVAGLFVLGAWMYGPALGLPLSLVDDYLFQRNMDHFRANFAAHGLLHAVTNDLSLTMETYNTGLFIWKGIEFAINGNHPFHWIRLIELALVCTLLLRMVVISAEGRRAGFYAGAAAVAVLLSGELPYGLDLHGLRINWYRLATSDADGLVFLSIFGLAVCHIIRGVKGESQLVQKSAWSMIAVIAACLAFSMKLPFAAIVLGSLLSLIVAALLCRDRRLALWFAGMLMAFLAVFSVYNIILRSLHVDVPGQTYGDNFSLSLPHLWEGFTTYARNYWNLYGPILPGTIILGVWAVPNLWRERIGPRKTMFLSAVFAAAFAATALAIYVPWNSRLPRYMLVSVFGFNLLGGILFAFALQALSHVWRTRRWALLLVPVGVAITLLPPMVLLLLSAIAAVLAVTRRAPMAISVAAGLMVAGFLYLFATAPALKLGVKYVYINREKANWEATLALLRNSAQGRNVCFVGNVADEITGSMSGHVSRMGVQPKLFAATDEANCGPGSLIMTLQWKSPPDQVAQATAGRKIVAEYGAVPGEFPIPVSFWVFRERLWQHDDKPKMVDYWKCEYVWRFYE